MIIPATSRAHHQGTSRPPFSMNLFMYRTGSMSRTEAELFAFSSIGEIRGFSRSLLCPHLAKQALERNNFGLLHCAIIIIIRRGIMLHQGPRPFFVLHSRKGSRRSWIWVILDANLLAKGHREGNSSWITPRVSNTSAQYHTVQQITPKRQESIPLSLAQPSVVHQLVAAAVCVVTSVSPPTRSVKFKTQFTTGFRTPPRPSSSESKWNWCPEEWRRQ